MAVNDADSNGSDRDARIAALYRKAADEEPPARLDRAIAGRARSTGRNPRGSVWLRWRLPLVAAAVAIVSGSLVALMLDESGERAQVRDETSPSATPERPENPEWPTRAGVSNSENSAKAGGAGPDDKSRRQARSREATTDEQTIAKPESKPTSQPRKEVRGADKPSITASSAPPPSPVPAPDSAVRAEQSVPTPPAQPTPQAKVTEAPAVKPLVRKDMGALRSAAPERDTKTGAAIGPLIAELEARPPADWLQRIIALRKADRRAEADALLSEFKRRYPNEPLPSVLQRDD